MTSDEGTDLRTNTSQRSKYSSLLKGLRLQEDDLEAGYIKISDDALVKLDQISNILTGRNPNMPRFVNSFLEHAVLFHTTHKIDLTGGMSAEQLLAAIDDRIVPEHHKPSLDRVIKEAGFQEKLAQEDPRSWPTTRIK